MPGLARRIIICAAVDGLLLQPVGLRSSDGAGVRIEYGSNKITHIEGDPPSENGLEAHGVIGLLNLISSSYLISITRHEQVAHVKGQPIFTIKDVTLVPLSSRSEAEDAIIRARRTLHPSNATAEYSDVDEEDDLVQTRNSATSELAEADAAALEPPADNLLDKGTSFVKDVIHNKGKFGRLAGSWFNRDAASLHTISEAESLSAPDADVSASHNTSDSTATAVHQGSPELTDRDSKLEDLVKRPKAIGLLTPRILRSTRLFFRSSGFFYSYDYNLSEGLCQQKDQASPIPLWRRFDSLFFWNQNLLRPFIESQNDAFILPIMQGFVGQREFTVRRTEPSDHTEGEKVLTSPHDDKIVKSDSSNPESQNSSHATFSLTLISRRSTKRAGLRYLRRGIDENGNVANFVETEQFLSPASPISGSRTSSLVQIRGSIPLYFSQSPYSFKPIPLLYGSPASNQAAFREHFTFLLDRYAKVQNASLVDKHGTEVNIGEAYEKQANSFNDSGGVNGQTMGFEWFDFHGVCKGMKFENVSILLDTLHESLSSFGWSVQEDGETIMQQRGVLRTNCMDCLDRTNVVQSAVGGQALQLQLADLGFRIDLLNDTGTQWFNTLWADNGDAISKQYAGTAALKGDFTRTRKRNWTGALSDFSLTLNRYYNNIFGDYFLQTCMDYYLGNVGANVFDEFETSMKSQDYALDMRSIRQGAIDTCVKIVLEDDEVLIAGWSLSCPHRANTLRSLPFEDCIVLLTTVALYFCRFDWNTEKVTSFERIQLTDITELWRGTYITNALGITNVDETQNVGFALKYTNAGPTIGRTNTRTLGNEHVQDNEGAEIDTKNTDDRIKKPRTEGESRLLAFKALPSRAAFTSGSASTSLEAVSEKELIHEITDKIYTAAIASTEQVTENNDPNTSQQPGLKLEERDLISVADAKRNTGYVESLSYSLKKLVWS